jgi:hypothetical protein
MAAWPDHRPDVLVSDAHHTELKPDRKRAPIKNSTRKDTPMKSIIRTATAAIFVAAACIQINQASAQTQLAGWNVQSLPDGAGGAPPALFAATSFATNYVMAGNLSKSTNSPGIQVVSTENEAYGGNGWTNTGFTDSEGSSITNGLSMAYSVVAAPGYTISFTENFLNFHTSSTGPSSAALQYCTDGVSYSNIALIAYGGGGGTSTVTGTNIVNLSTNAFLQNVPPGITNYFRLVNWGATSSNGTWYIYNSVTTNAGLQLLGTVQTNTQLAAWNVNGIGTNTGGAGGPPPALFAATSFATNYVIAGNLSKGTNGAGIGTVTTGTAEYGGNGWYSTSESESNSITNGLFIAYSVAADPGYSISFTEQFLNYHNSATGPTNGALQYCTDGVSYSNIALMTYSPYDTAATSNNYINLSPFPFLQNVPAGTTNYFRLVNWGTDGTGTAGTWYIYNSVTTNAGLQLLGTVQSLLAAWNVSTATDGGGSPPAPFAATYAAPNVVAGSLTKGTTPGPGAITTAGVYGGNAWYSTSESEAISISNGLYVEYSAQSQDGFVVSFTDMLLNWHNSATGPTNGALQYCTDGVSYSNIYLISYAPYDTAETLTTNINLSTNLFLQNVPASNNNYFRIVNWGTEGTGTAGTWYIDDSGGANSAGLQLIGYLTSFAIIAPTNLVVTPASLTVGAGSTAEFSVSANGSPASYLWYIGPANAGTPIASATNAALILTNVLGSNSGSYFVVLSNSAGMATSAVVTLTVIDPFDVIPPNNAEGFVGGQAQFSAAVLGTSPTLNWYQNNGSGTWTLIANGSQPSGSTVSGQGTSTLTISDVQPGDTNGFAFIELIASDAYGTNTSPAVSLLNASTSGAVLAQYVFNGVSEVTGVQDGLPDSGILAQWDFNGIDFTNAQLNPPPYTGIYNPAAPAVFFPPPWIGVGSATAVGCAFAPEGGPSGISPYSGAVVAGTDGAGYTTNLPNFSFGTENYPLVGSNKLNGVQFMTSTVGAKNINVSYYLRETGTSSEYTRLQYTTNAGGDWTDYPASSSFPGSDVNLFAPIYTYDLSGFPGAANNPDFGIRVVTEFQSTATYGIGSQGGNPLYITNGYVGCDNLYSSGSPTGTTSAGTLTFDLITIGGQPLNEAIYSPPTISAITNISPTNGFNLTNGISVANGESNYDFVNITNTFIIGSAISPVSNLLVSAQSLNPSKVNPGFLFSLSNTTVTMVMTAYPIPDPLDAAPIVVTVTDPSTGDSTVEWFLLTLQSLNLPPTNSLTSIIGTNMLANSTLSIPFYVGSYDGSNSLLTYSSNSLNNTVIPTTNLALTNLTLTNLVLSITSASNQLGQGVVSVTVYDNNPLEPRFTTATFPVMVRPNTNVILIDYFNYDNSGPLEVVSDGYWSHLSGNENQMQVENGLIPNSVTIDTLDYTENLQAPLLGAPYYTNSAASNTAPVLYASYIITMADPTKLPILGGAYVTAFDDGSGNTGTAHVECGLWVQTNGAAPGHYRLGISDFPAQEGAGVTYPQDLSVGTSYVVVTALNLSNGFSTLWINPNGGQSSPSVQDTTTAIAAGGTNLNMADFELRQSGADAGSVSLSKLKVGTTFDSIFPSLHIQVVGANVVLTWSDPTLGIQASPDLISPWVVLTNATSPYTNALGTNTEMYFMLTQ